MLTAAENELLTRVGPGTPMGGLMRRYWHPIAALAEMKTAWTKRVRLLGEDLVLFRDRSGRFGLIEELCPHRRASLAYGIPAIDGLRCPYHGWKFDASGACIEQPNEPPESNFKNKIHTPAYPVEELGGLLFAYLGPEPRPLVPRLDGYVAPGAIRMIGRAVVPCNWQQIMENSVDPVHTEWLHGRMHAFQIRVPMDDTHTLHLWYNAYVPLNGAHVPQRLLDEVPVYDVPFLDAGGDYLVDLIDAQDIMAWVSQGPIADRTRETLGAPDRGVTLLRRMLRRELQKVADGQDPIGVIRDPRHNHIALHIEKAKAHYADGFENLVRRTRIRYSPVVDELIGVFAPAAQRA